MSDRELGEWEPIYVHDRQPWAIGNVALLATLAAVVFALVRIFRAAHNDPTTSLAIFDAVGGPSAALAVAANEIQRLVEVGLLLSVAAFMQAEYPRVGRHEREVNVLAFVVFFFWISVSAIGSWVLASVSVVLGLPFVLRRFLAPWMRSGHEPRPAQVARDRAFRNAPEIPDSAPESLRRWFESRRATAEARRRELRKEASRLERLSPEARDALAVRDLNRARALISEEPELSDDDLLDLAERIPPRRGLLRQNAKIRNLVLVLALGFMFAQALSDSVWLPPESIEIDGEGPRVGYVLDAEDAAAVVLWEEPRLVERVQKDSIVTREICLPDHDWSFRTLPELIGGEADPPPYPACP